MTYNLISGLLPTLAAAGLIAFYFLILKPKQDGKKIKQRQAESQANTAPAEPDPYAEVIDDYPTYHRQG